MPDNFAAGEMDADLATPPITSETMGARMKISVAHPGEGVHQDLQEPYLMPSVHGRNGSTERTVPGIVQTPLGGMMPGPFAIPPAVVVGMDYRAPVPEEAGPFAIGVGDSFPEGCPIPFGQ